MSSFYSHYDEKRSFGGIIPTDVRGGYEITNNDNGKDGRLFLFISFL